MSLYVTREDVDLLVTTIEAAEQRWGTEFDDANTLNDWCAYIGIYTARAADMQNRTEPSVQYDALMKVAGLALTAAARVREGAVAKRHYDV